MNYTNCFFSLSSSQNAGPKGGNPWRGCFRYHCYKVLRRRRIGRCLLRAQLRHRWTLEVHRRTRVRPWGRHEKYDHQFLQGNLLIQVSSHCFRTYIIGNNDVISDHASQNLSRLSQHYLFEIMSATFSFIALNKWLRSLTQPLKQWALRFHQ